MSRGLRNNNPGNIRISSETFQGEVKPSGDPEFKQFESLNYGYRAVFKIIFTYMRKYDLDTIEKIIARWAPVSENNTEDYIKFVSDSTGIPRTQALEASQSEYLIPIVSAISKMENGQQADQAIVKNGYELAYGIIERAAQFIQKKKALSLSILILFLTLIFLIIFKNKLNASNNT